MDTLASQAPASMQVHMLTPASMANVHIQILIAEDGYLPWEADTSIYMADGQVCN